MTEHVSRSLSLARTFLGCAVEVVMDRPLGSRHPRHGFLYEANYGFVPGTLAPDGEPLDAYVLGVRVLGVRVLGVRVLGVQEPLARASGRCTVVIHRRDDDDDKLVVVVGESDLSDDAIWAAVRFQEQFFDACIVQS